MKLISLPMFRAIVNAKAPVLDLVEIYFTRQAAPDLRLALFDNNVVWNSQQYLRAGAAPVQVSQSIREATNDITLSIPDLYDSIAAAIETLDLGGTPIQVRQVVAGAPPSSTDSVLRYLGIINSAYIENKTAVISCQSITVDSQGLNKVPRRTFGIQCQYRFGDDSCSVDVSQHAYKGLAQSGSSKFAIVDDGVDDVQVARVWVPSVVLFTSGDLLGQSRPVLSVTRGKIELRKPFYSDPSPSDTYELLRKCLHDIDACDGFNNRGNFGGFYTTPKEPRNLRREIS